MTECGTGKPRCGRGTRCNKKTRRCEGAAAEAPPSTALPRPPSPRVAAPAITKKSPPSGAQKCGTGAPKCARGTRCNKKTRLCEGSAAAPPPPAPPQDIKKQIKETIRAAPPLKESEVVRPAAAAATPDLVLYVFAHGEVLNEPLKKPIMWFSKVPINGCVLITDTSTEKQKIYKLRKYYEAGLPSKEVLKHYCEETDKNILIQQKSIIGYIIMYLPRIIDIFQYFIKQKEERPEIYVNDTYLILLGKMIDIIDATKNVPLKSTDIEKYNKMTEQDQWEIVEAISQFHKFFNENERKIFDMIFPQKKIEKKDPFKKVEEFKKMVEYSEIIVKIKNAYVTFYGMKKLLKKGKNLQCKFMYLKKNKQYTFYDPNTKEFGLYVLYNKHPLPNQKLLEYDNMTETWRFNNYDLKTVKLSDILEDMRGLGYNNVLVYDMTCNARSEYIDSKTFSSMAAAITTQRRNTSSTKYSDILQSL